MNAGKVIGVGWLVEDPAVFVAAVRPAAMLPHAVAVPVTVNEPVILYVAPATPHVAVEGFEAFTEPWTVPVVPPAMPFAPPVHTFPDLPEHPSGEYVLTIDAPFCMRDATARRDAHFRRRSRCVPTVMSPAE